MKKILIVLIVLVCGSGIKAQTIFNDVITVSWDINLPTSNRDFIGNTSFQGFQFGYKKKINNRLYAGFDFNNTAYHDHADQQSYAADDGVSTTAVYKYIYSYGLVLTGDYIFRPFKKFMPFTGLGLGVNFNSYKTYYNIYGSSDNGTGVLIRPQAGAWLKLGKNSKVAISGVVHYDYSSAGSRLFDISSFTSLGFRLGIALNISNREQ